MSASADNKHEDVELKETFEETKKQLTRVTQRIANIKKVQTQFKGELHEVVKFEGGLISAEDLEALRIDLAMAQSELIRERDQLKKILQHDADMISAVVKKVDASKGTLIDKLEQYLDRMEREFAKKFIQDYPNFGIKERDVKKDVINKRDPFSAIAEKDKSRNTFYVPTYKKIIVTRAMIALLKDHTLDDYAIYQQLKDQYDKAFQGYADTIKSIILQRRSDEPTRKIGEIEREGLDKLIQDFIDIEHQVEQELLHRKTLSIDAKQSPLASAGHFAHSQSKSSQSAETEMGVILSPPVKKQ